MADSRRVFMSRFAGYRLRGTNKYGENLPEQWEYAADLMKKQGHLPAGFDPKEAYTNELIDQINDWDRGAVEAKAKAWTPT